MGADNYGFVHDLTEARGSFELGVVDGPHRYVCVKGQKDLGGHGEVIGEDERLDAGQGPQPAQKSVITYEKKALRKGAARALLDARQDLDPDVSGGTEDG